MAIVLLNYSRSGGTLLSSILGRLDNVVMVSEVNPVANNHTSVKEQVKDWYDIDISYGSFSQMILELNDYCIQNNRTLLIRDYSFADFTPHSLNNFDPKYHFSTLTHLQELIPLKVFAFVRDSFDIWISRNCPPKFSEGYLKYVKYLVKLQIPIFKYEEFCDNPESEFSEICAFIGVPYNKHHLGKPNSFHKTTGDNLIKKASRGRKLNQITRLKRQQIPKKWRIKGAKNFQLLEANKQLNYSAYFNATEMEDTDFDWVNLLKWTWYQYRNPSHFHPY